MNKNEILKIYGTDYKAMTIRLLTEADLASHIGRKDARIGIKPNLVSPTPASFGGTTHPEVVEGIIEYLKDHGYNDLRILEGSWVGDKTEEAFTVCGYRALSKATGVPLIDLQKDSAVTKEAKGLPIDVCTEAASLDFLINVPVIKGHCQTKITCALKNMKGLIPNREKRRFHGLGLHDPIAHLNAAIRQDFIVADHICGDLDFEDGGHPVIHNGIFAATDPVLLDAYVCRLLGVPVSEVPYITKAEALGVGSADLATAFIHSVDDVDPEGDNARTCDRKMVELSDAVCEVESCSACYAYLLPALDKLREDGLLEVFKETLSDRICIGQGYRGKTGAFGVGNCTKNFDFTIKGCPPLEHEVYAGLRRYLKEKAGIPEE